MSTKPNRPRKIIAQNRRARHDYEIIETYEAGIVLQGTEVKALREGKVSLQDSFAMFKDGELWVVGMYIGPYSQGNISNHPPRRDRKLLLHRRELRKLEQRVKERGFTLIPLSVYFSGPYVKIELALVRGKRKYEKREAIKERDVQRELRRTLRQR